MTGNPQFNQRSDNAALRLKADINARNAGQADFQPLESSPVAVNPDGSLPAPPPPDGSYARMAHDQQQAQLRAEQQHAAQQAQAAMQGQPTQEQVVGQQPPAGTPTQQSDGSVAPPLASGTPQPAAPAEQPQTPPISENANARIQQLIQENREKDRLIAESAATSSQLQELRQQNTALQAERDSFIQNHLDELPPEERAAVLSEARTRELLEQNNAMLLGAINQQLQPLQQQSQQSEMERVAEKYPGFDMTIHPSLVDQLRAKVPQLTYEMAFKAVAEGDEAVTREQAAHVAVPPVVPAGNGAPLPRYMPEPTPNPEDALVDYQQRTNALIASTDPLEQRQGYRQLDDVLKERLSGASYEGKPSVFD